LRQTLLHLARLIGKRLIWMALTLWAVYTITFVLMRLSPGGPYSSEKKVPPAIQRNLEAKFKMNDPWYVQYGSQMWDALRGDLRPSMKLQDYTVNEVIAQGFPVSAALGIFALTFALMFGMTAGVISAVRRNSLYDYGFMAAATIGIAVPNFVLASVAILIIVFQLHLLPPAGWGSREHIWLPALCLAAPYTAYIARLTRAGMLEVLNLDYIRTAYAKGLAPRTVIVKHALRGAILPVVSYIGPAAAGILTGSLILERIFNIPGIGSHFIEAAGQRDFTLAMGIVLLSTVMVYVMNMLVDLSYALIDPRVKVE
jgi:ABC-type dipeptide/oligopeptide/nickel transport system permease component